MAQTHIVKINEQYFVYTWTTGFVPVPKKDAIRGDDDAIAYAMYLARRGNQDAAEAFLDKYCS